MPKRRQRREWLGDKGLKNSAGGGDRSECANAAALTANLAEVA
jgi:hypothetical protein